MADLFEDDNAATDIDLRGDTPPADDGTPPPEGDEKGANAGDDAAPPAEDLDAEALAALAAEDDDDDKGGKKSPAVPHARFNEVNEQLKAERQAREDLQRRLEALENGGKPAESKDDEPPAFDIKAARRQYTEALMEGDTDKALEIQDQIDAEMMRLAEERAEQKLKAVAQERQQQKAADLFNAVADKAEADYPQLKPGSETYSEEAVEMVNALVAQGLQKGEAGHVALQNAVAKVAKLYAWQAPASNEIDKDKAKQGQENAVKRGVETGGKQPPVPAGTVGNRDREPGKIDVAKVDKDDWDDLPKAERDKLLGRV